ncbi:hypothetical protein PHSY_002854 [Pseudozyma hubeiensis SY62]|uniref:Uncharacterized protein n=1 Tax=Pseudozyma hubeiensis (strain SY62) TaxID=1305764 RepID=R9P221_PSEHS|nr:hypothetical protein PHSY_002854 [Pseudozyma hubeiensis SY62]GAC95279.1 hypothetical protein PHSY_002854 [Pseudozyma hubeiensis SY62]
MFPILRQIGFGGTVLRLSSDVSFFFPFESPMVRRSLMVLFEWIRHIRVPNQDQCSDSLSIDNQISRLELEKKAWHNGKVLAEEFADRTGTKHSTTRLEFEFEKAEVETRKSQEPKIKGGASTFRSTAISRSNAAVSGLVLTCVTLPCDLSKS